MDSPTENSSRGTERPLENQQTQPRSIMNLRRSITKTKNMFQLSGIALLTILISVSCNEKKSQNESEEKESNLNENSSSFVQKRISVQQAMERLQEYALLKTDKFSSEIIAHYNRYQNGDEKISSYPYLVKILSLGDSSNKTPISCIQAFLDEGLDINQQCNGETPLLAAIRKNNTDAALYLIERGADINLVGNLPRDTIVENGTRVYSYGGSYAPLNAAFLYNNKKLIKLLIHKGANINNKESRNYPLLTTAIHNGDRELIELLLTKRPDLNVGEFSPLLAACAKNDMETTKILLQQKSDIMANDSNNNTPLHIASLNENVKMAELLLAHGIDINSKNKQGDTALKIAFDKRNVELQKLFLKNEHPVEKTNFWQQAIKQGDIEIVELLYNKGSKPGAEESNLAMRYGFSDIVKFFIDKGIEVNFYDKNVIVDIIKNGDTKTLKYLLDLGLDLKGKDGFKRIYSPVCPRRKSYRYGRTSY